MTETRVTEWKQIEEAAAGPRCAGEVGCGWVTAGSGASLGSGWRRALPGPEHALTALLLCDTYPMGFTDIGNNTPATLLLLGTPSLRHDCISPARPVSRRCPRRGSGQGRARVQPRAAHALAHLHALRQLEPGGGVQHGGAAGGLGSGGGGQTGSMLGCAVRSPWAG